MASALTFQCGGVARRLWPKVACRSATSSKEQGEVLFRHVKRFITPNLPAFKVYDTANNLRVVSKDTGVLLMVKASDPARLHGAAPSLVIADEVAQWPRTRVDAMLAALRTAMGSIPDSRLVAIGTRASTPSHPFERLLADADFTMTFAARSDDPIGQKRTWLRANPSLRYFPDLERAYRKEVKSAKRDPSLLTAFKALRLNLGVSDTVEPPTGCGRLARQ